MKHCHKKSVAHMNLLSVFGHDKPCYYCPRLSGEAVCSHLEHLAQIRAALKLVREDIKGSRSWLGDEARLPCRDPLLLVRLIAALTDVKKETKLTPASWESC